MEKRLKEFKGHKMGELQNFKELLERATKLYGTKVAFQYKKDIKKEEYTTHTFQEYKDDVVALATGLMEKEWLLLDQTVMNGV